MKSSITTKNSLPVNAFFGAILSISVLSNVNSVYAEEIIFQYDNELDNPATNTDDLNIVNETYKFYGQGDFNGINTGTIHHQDNAGVTFVEILSGNSEASDTAAKMGGDLNVTNNGDISSNLAVFGLHTVGGAINFKNNKTISSSYSEQILPILFFATGAYNDGACTQDYCENGIKGGDITFENTGMISSSNAIAVSSLSFGGNITITNTGDITSAHEALFAISYARENFDSGAVIINNEGDLTTTSSTSQNAMALVGYSQTATVDITNKGKIETFGQDANGIAGASGINVDDDLWPFASLGQAVKISNMGDITTHGRDGNAIIALSNVGLIEITNEAALSTSGMYANGIKADSGASRQENRAEERVGGAVTINNSGEINTASNYSYSINGWSNGGAVNVTNSGALNTKGFDSHGIGIYSGTNTTEDNRVIQKGGDVTVNNSGAINTASDYSYSINGWSNGGAVNVTNSGQLNTAGMGSHAIDVYSGTNRTEGDRVIQDGGDVTLNNSGNISTTGYYADGIHAGSYGGHVNVVNTGKINTFADSSNSINATSGNNKLMEGRVIKTGQSVLVTNEASLSTKGYNANIIHAWSNGGAVQVYNTGQLLSLGEFSRGLGVFSGHNRENDETSAQLGGDITVNNAGIIDTEKNDSLAIDAWSNGGAINVTNSGQLSTAGMNSNAIGIYSGTNRTEDDRVIQDGGDVTLDNSGDISTTGYGANGVFAGSYGGDVNVINEGGIVTEGGNSHGLEMRSGYTSTYDGGVPKIGGDITLSNKGAITTHGEYSHTIRAGTVGANITIENSGNLTVHDYRYSEGISAISYNLVNQNGDISTEGKDVTIINSGDITTYSEDSSAIDGESHGGKVNIINSGDIRVTGFDVEAIVGFSGLDNDESNALIGDDVAINNSGTIKIEGEDSLGVVAFSNGGNAQIINSGNIYGLAQNIHGIGIGSINSVKVENSGNITVQDNSHSLYVISNGATEIFNSGLIQSTNKSALNFENFRVDVEDETFDPTVGSKDTVINSGSIIGGAEFFANDDTLKNTGTLSGVFDFGLGNDTFESDGGNIENASFIGAEGTDSVIFKQGASIKGASFSGFENLSLQSGVFTATNLENFIHVQVGENAQLNYSGSLVSSSITGRTNIASSKVLNISNNLSVTGSGVLNLAFESTTDHAQVNVGDVAHFDSASNLFISSSQDNSLAKDDRVSLINANSITIGGEEEGTSFTIEDNIAGFNFKGIIQQGTEKLKALYVTAESAFTQLANSVSPEVKGEAEELFTALDNNGNSDQPLNKGQQEAFQDVQEIISDVATNSPEQLSGLVTDLSKAAPAEATSSGVNTASISTSTNLVQSRVQSRVGQAFNAPAANTGNTANNYQAENKTFAKVQSIVSLADTGSEFSLGNEGGGEIWAQVYGAYQRSDINSVDTKGNNWGISAGADYFITPQLLVGASLAYSKGTINSTIGTGTNQIDNHTIGGSVYTGYSFDSGTSLSASLGYFHGRNDVTRESLGNIYTADFDSHTFVAQSVLAHNFDFDEINLTPSVGLTYIRNHSEAYTENGTGGLARTVSSMTSDSLVGNIGLSISKNITVDGLSITPEVHANVLYEFNDTLGNYSLALANGAVSFNNIDITPGNRLRYNIGGSFKIKHTDVVSTQFSYDGIFADNTQQHIGRARIMLKF